MPNNLLLIKHIKDIIPLVFQEAPENCTIDVFDKNSVSTIYMNIIQNNIFEQLVVLNFNETIPNLKNKCKKLSKLLNKEVTLFEDGNTKTIYWFEGLKGTSRTELKQEGSDAEKRIQKLKSDTRLPNWLDSFIFKNLNAKYAPDFEKFDYNLEHSEEELLIYLGTYFPRSYAESFCIFEDLLGNKILKSKLMENKELNILDIGCGTGGNLMGLITLINKYFPSTFTLNIWAIDGNQNALKILNRIIKKFKQHSRISINQNIIPGKFKDTKELKKIIQNIPCQSFDFIMSFKTICEIISKGKGKLNNSYFEIFKHVCPMLNDNGLFLLLDVTTRTEHSGYFPILLNEQARNFTKSYNEFKILAPLSCNTYSNICNNKCFYQQDFSVSHKQKINDISRVAYKIIGRTIFIESLTMNYKKNKFIINWKRFSNEFENNGCCLNSLNESGYFDAFKIS